MAAAHNKHRKHRILKLGLKLTVFSLMMLGASVAFGSGGKVLADTPPSSCPSDIGGAGFNEANARGWGVPVTEPGGGPDGGNMAGIVVQAYDASTNKPVDLHYTLKSSIDGNQNEQVWNPPANGQPGYDYDYNARIFDATNSSNGNTDFANRRESYTTGTGYASDGYATVIQSGTGQSWQCAGWSAFGPQNEGSAMAGNGRVLDCGALVTSGGATATVKQYTKFWFTSLSDSPSSYNGNPDNGSNGYWSVDVTNTSNNTDVHIDHWTGNNMGYDPTFNNDYFNVNNGSNAYVQFIWHPQPITHTTPPSVDGTSTCQNLTVDEDAGTGNKTRVWVTVDGPIALGKEKYTDNSGNVTWTPDTNPSGNGSVHYGDPGQPAPPGSVASWVGPGGEDGDSGISVSKEWWWQPEANSITVSVRTDQLPQTWDSSANGGKGGYDYKNSSWNNGTPSTTTYDCFADSTCTTALTVDGDLQPGNEVEAGGSMHVSGTYKNTGELPLWNPSVYAPDGNYYPVNVSGGVLNPGDSAPFSFTMTAPNQVEYDPVGVTGYYFGQMTNPSSCDASTTVPIYQYFSSALAASSDLEPTTEHPDQGDNYSTTITVQNGSSHTVDIPTSTSFYKKPAGGGTITYNSASNPPPGNNPAYPSASTSPGAVTTLLSGHQDIPDGSYQAGDEYCAYAHADYTTGYVGPDSSVVGGANPADQYSCPRIVNEPYFKVVNGDISAGGDFDKCTTNGGELAGYNDISDPAGADRGASSQLSALALIKITGVASAQTPGNITRSPTDLTFANAGSGVTVDSTGTESPALGGSFGGCATLTNETAPSGATTLSNNTLSLNSLPTPSTPNIYAYNYGTSTSPANMTISGGTLSAGSNVSVFVNGNVYISGNIGYAQTTGWTAGTAPSFILHATGNIYISPNVTSLSGLYIAQQQTKQDGTPDTTTGKIYTCADTTGFAPTAATDLYNRCNNQLVVYGSFVADQVNLMRTLGSLRDEAPVTGTAPGPNANTSVAFNRYYCGSGNPPGSVPFPSTHFYQTASTPAQPASVPGGCNLEGTIGYTLPTQSNGSTPLYYVNGSGGNDYLYTTSYSEAQQDGGRPCPGGCNPGIAGYVFTYQASGTEPLYGVFNGNTDTTSTHFYTTSAAEYSSVCSTVTSGGGGICLGPIAYIYASPGQGGTPTTVQTPLGPPNPMPCSNSGARSINNTCAGEVFEFSPQLYLSNGGGTVCPAGGCGGPLQYQSLTSLPPVL